MNRCQVNLPESFELQGKFELSLASRAFLRENEGSIYVYT